MRAALVVVAVVLLAAGCGRRKDASLPKYEATPVDRMVEADDKMVDGCKFLGTVKGSSGWGGSMGASVGQERATADAIKRAGKQGATHYVLSTASSSSMGSSATVKAYRCEEDEPTPAASATALPIPAPVPVP